MTDLILSEKFLPTESRTTFYTILYIDLAILFSFETMGWCIYLYHIHLDLKYICITVYTTHEHKDRSTSLNQISTRHVATEAT